MKIDSEAFYKLSYGLFVLTSAENGRDNGCIINTVMQVADTPKLIAAAVNKNNLTHDMIMNTGVFNVSVLGENADFDIFRKFGFKSGRQTDKFSDIKTPRRSENGLIFIDKVSNAFISGKVKDTLDCVTHTLFTADVTEAEQLSNIPSMTYRYYFENVKPKPEIKSKKGFICKICGYVYEGETLPADYICPLCRHPAEDFEPIE